MPTRESRPGGGHAAGHSGCRPWQRCASGGAGRRRVARASGRQRVRGCLGGRRSVLTTHARGRRLLRPMRCRGACQRKAGQRGGVPTTAAGCRASSTLYAAWWTCGRVEGVAATHQAAARAIRPGVLCRESLRPPSSRVALRPQQLSQSQHNVGHLNGYRATCRARCSSALASLAGLAHMRPCPGWTKGQK